MSPSVDIFYVVFFQILLVYTVESSDIGGTLFDEGRPVEWCGLFDTEAIRLRFVQCFRDSCGVPGDLFRYTADVVR